MRVLVVDDDDDIRRVARLSLERVGGMQVLEASGGDEGVRTAETEQPDVILLDVTMPAMDGVATLSALRANPATSRIPVVFLTAKAMTPEVRQLQDLGARAILVKPFDPLLLPEQLRGALGLT
jgi:two-component system alkaline phosphatase synthesis response regulator PhoP